MPEEERGPGSGRARTSREKEIGVSLATPEKIRKLQRALYVKAKQEPTRRFHFLYDKVWRENIVAPAYARRRANGGAPSAGRGALPRTAAYRAGRRAAETPRGGPTRPPQPPPRSPAPEPATPA